MSSEKNNNEQKLLDVVFKLLYLIIALMILVACLIYINIAGVPDIFKTDKFVNVPATVSNKSTAEKIKNDFWIAPDTSTIPNDEGGKQIRYGRMLISNTAYYLGPNGIVDHISNGMNCQNCHLDAGTKIFGNNYSAVSSTYPKFRERSGSIESIYKRVNDCFERSLNGKGLDTVSKEMQAIKAYISWLGKDVKKGEKPKGSGLMEVDYMNVAANPEKGKLVYKEKCASCHGQSGEGKMNENKMGYQYPPLWGNSSYNIGAGLYRLSRFAGYIKTNMPFGATFDNPQLSYEEAWNIAAFVNSQTRPSKDLKKDWPKITAKPVDHPFGPFADKFSEEQHKYGPFKPIADFKKKQKEKK